MNENQKQKWLQNRKDRRKLDSIVELVDEIQSGDRNALSRGITLIESVKESDQQTAKELIKECLQRKINQTVRIGITGVPGVGKSSFIEVFGLWLIEQGKKVAILAIDPSSATNSGSILGDKTRMNELSIRPEAFIRPSPAGKSLGGVARKTRESIILCEVAGYDVVLIETVGVGQSEILVHSMVDFFLLLMLSGAGDELQGIKRGIMELADLLIVNKADGDNKKMAQAAARSYKNALHLFPPKENNWIAETMTSSSTEDANMEKIWEVIQRFVQHNQLNGSFDKNRNEQNLKWFREELNNLMMWVASKNPEAKKDRNKLETEVQNGKISPFDAAEAWVKTWILKDGI